MKPLTSTRNTTLKAQMTPRTNAIAANWDPMRRRYWDHVVIAVTLVVTGGALMAILVLGMTTTTTNSVTVTSTKSSGPPPFPIGIVDTRAPSKMAPPGVNALSGYVRDYVSNFDGNTLPSGWYTFSGIPGGDPSGRLENSHVVVSDGLLRLNTWKDPAYGGNWVSGGLCQCGLPRTYGAFFVRSRVTGPGPSAISLLWPANNTWPPEIDFNENGGNARGTSATVHFGVTNQIDQSTISIDMTKWHTWGVIWSQDKITFTVDGQVWARVTTPLEIPNIPMRLDMEQRTACGTGLDCPTEPQSMLIDWVAEYSKA
jgi:Glycosyl hydrolases family 16